MQSFAVKVTNVNLRKLIVQLVNENGWPKDGKNFEDRYIAEHLEADGIYVKYWTIIEWNNLHGFTFRGKQSVAGVANGTLVGLIDMVSRPYAKPIEVQLNAEYTALVSKNEVQVGCQKIPYSKILEIVQQHDKYHTYDK